MSLKEARIDSREILEKFSGLGGVGNARVVLQGEQPNARVKSICKDLLKEGKDGQILTRVMRLPGLFSSAMLEFLLGSRPYEHDHANLQVKLKNVGPQRVSIHLAYEWHAELDSFGNELPSGYSEEHRRWVDPGETVTLSPQAAVHALYDRCKDAWKVTEAAHSWPGIADDFVEVGYSCVLDGQHVTASAKKRRAA